jgi:hypothetical protein
MATDNKGKTYVENPLDEMSRPAAIEETRGANDSSSWAPLTTIKDSGERQTFSSGSMRDPSTGKIKWSRITFGPMMRRWAQHLTTAEAKYPDPTPGFPNFMLIETEEERIRYRESAFRHFMSWFNGETDEDHAAAVFFNLNGVEIIDEKRRAKQLTKEPR